MEIDFQSDKNKHTLNIQLDEKDVNDAREIIRMMEEKKCPNCGHDFNNGWEILMGYLHMARESIILKIERVGVSEPEWKMAAIRAAILKGFDECRAIPQRVIERAKEYLEDGRNRDEKVHIED